MAFMNLILIFVKFSHIYFSSLSPWTYIQVGLFSGVNASQENSRHIRGERIKREPIFGIRNFGSDFGDHNYVKPKLFRTKILSDKVTFVADEQAY